MVQSWISDSDSFELITVYESYKCVNGCTTKIKNPHWVMLKIRMLFITKQKPGKHVAPIFEGNLLSLLDFGMERNVFASIRIIYWHKCEIGPSASLGLNLFRIQENRTKPIQKKWFSISWATKKNKKQLNNLSNLRKKWII